MSSHATCPLSIHPFRVFRTASSSGKRNIASVPSNERAGNGKPFSVKQPGNDRHPAGQDTAESANMVHGRTRKGQGPDSVPALSPGSLCRVKSVDPFDFMLDIQ